MPTTTTRTVSTTVAMSEVVDALDVVANQRPNLDAYIRQGASDVLRALEPIEADIMDGWQATAATRHAALDLLVALEGGLSGVDNRTYGVDRAKVTPLIEDMLRAIVIGSVKFDTEVK